MSKFKGTKGKWVVKLDHKISSFHHVEIANKRVITVEGTNEIEPKANALLISKAPEMLEMLEYLVESKLLYTTKAEIDIIQLIKEATEL